MPDIPDLAPLEDQPAETNIYLCKGLFVKHAVFAKGTVIPQHSHDLNHLSVIAHGAARVWQDGKCLGDFSAPAGVLIEAHSKHTFMALADNTAVLCVHRLDENGEIPIQEEHQLEGV